METENFIPCATADPYVQLIDDELSDDEFFEINDEFSRDEFFEINDELMRIEEYLREMEEQVGNAGLDTSNVRDYDEFFEIDDELVRVVMSYEDLLEMEERVGRVNVGLSEETISKHLKTSSSSTAATRVDDHSRNELEEAGAEICVVCQYEYESNEKVGTLQCGHHYHADCIKEWLLQHNVCPICKSTALVV